MRLTRIKNKQIQYKINDKGSEMSCSLQRVTFLRKEMLRKNYVMVFETKPNDINQNITLYYIFGFKLNDYNLQNYIST